MYSAAASKRLGLLKSFLRRYTGMSSYRDVLAGVMHRACKQDMLNPN